MTKKATPTKRNTKSWKGEAQKLERLLVEACGEINGNVGDIAPIELDEWWKAYQSTAKARASEAKRLALSKLTPADRVALGVGEAAPKDAKP